MVWKGVLLTVLIYGSRGKGIHPFHTIDTAFSQSLIKSCALTIFQFLYYNGLKQVFELFDTKYAILNVIVAPLLNSQAAKGKLNMLGDGTFLT